MSRAATTRAGPSGSAPPRFPTSARAGRRLLVRLARVTVGLAMFVALGPAQPASAHSLGPSGSSNYLTTLTGISPPTPGVSARVVDDGQHIEVTDSSPVPLVILGNYEEPYLMVDAAGVWENVRSPSVYIDNSAGTGLVYYPPDVNANAPPRWKRVCACDTARWHDHRIHWGSANPPPAVSASPGHYHLINVWHIEAREGTRPVTFTGTLAWVPGPSPAPWIAAMVATMLVVAAVGFLRRWRIPLATVLLTLLGVDVARTAGSVLGRSGPLHTQLQAVPDGGVAMIIGWLVLVTVAVFALRGGTGAAYGAIAAGLVVALSGGVPNLAALWQSQVITAYPVDLQRFLISLTVGLGTGLVLAGWLLLRRLDPVADGDQAGADTGRSDTGSRSTYDLHGTDPA